MGDPPPAEFDEYQIIRPLGAGAMGEVFLARDLALDRAVAIKFLAVETNAAARQQFLVEARAIARLQHPNVVAVHRIGEAAARPYLVSEYVDGKSLDCLTEVLAWPRALDIAIDLARGLGAAHRRGVLHRDIKPANAILGADGRAKLLDFGLAKLLDEAELPVMAPWRRAYPTDLVATRPRQRSDDSTRAALTPEAPGPSPTGLIGTPRYMAPELWRRKEATRESDVYALGVLLYELLAGRSPHQREATSLAELGEMVVNEEPRPLLEVAPGTPRRLAAIVGRCLARDPAARFRSGEELCAALEELRTPPRRWIWPLAGLAGVGAAAAAALLLRGGPPPAAQETVRAAPPLKVLSTRRLTVEAGCEEFPSFTPDGRTLLYDGAVGGTYAIFALDLETGVSRRLTHSAGWDYAPAVSPDGTRFAFLRNSPKTAVYVAPLPGGEPVQKLIVGSFRPTWSADPRYLWAGPWERPTKVDATTGAVLTQRSTPPGSIASVGAEGPDGELLVPLFNEAGQGLGVALLTADAEPRWIEKAWYEEAMALMPDRRHALASRNVPGGKPVLVRVGMDGSAEALTLGEIQARTGIAMTADGRRLAWSNCGAERDLAFVERGADGAPHLTKVAAGDWIDADPTAIPGSDKLVVVSDRRGSGELWVIDPTGSEPARRLPSGAATKTGSAVSPDGRWVVYGSGDAPGLHVLALDGSDAPRRLTEDPSDSQPGVSVDGRVYFARDIGDGRWQILRVPLAGGTPTVVVPEGSTSAVSPDGRTLVFVRRGEPYLADLASGAERRLSPDPIEACTRVAFSGDGKRVAVISNERLTLIDRATGAQERVFTSSTELLNGIAFVGDRPLVAVQRWEGDLWLAETETTP